MNNNNFNSNDDDIMPRNCRQEEEAICARECDEQEHGQLNEGVPHGADQVSSSLKLCKICS